MHDPAVDIAELNLTPADVLALVGVNDVDTPCTWEEYLEAGKALRGLVERGLLLVDDHGHLAYPGPILRLLPALQDLRKAQAALAPRSEFSASSAVADLLGLLP